MLLRIESFVALLPLLVCLANCNPTLPQKPASGCAILGYPNATLNDCGYCVGPDTGLEYDFGRDCLGACNGGAKLDCSGVCDGAAYLDECTGDCISDNAIERRPANSTRRDCRGSCTQSELSPSQYAYKKDDCGVCRLQGESSSPFVDCSGKCRVPGSPRAITVCDQCVEQSQQSRYLDDCGNCPSKGTFCSCLKDPSQCGCNDSRFCFKAKALSPQVIAKRVESRVTLSGFFAPENDELFCLFQHQNTGEIISSQANFMLDNKTSIYCNVKLSKEGIWALALQYKKNGQEILDGSANLVLMVYDKLSARFASLSPIDVLTTEFKAPITLKFSSPSITNIPPVPLVCKIGYGDPNEKETLALSGSEPFTCVLPDSLSHKRSRTLFISPTFDGVEPLGHPLTFTIIAPSPTISHQNCFISSDGLSVVIMFEKPVDLTAKEMKAPSPTLCSHVLTIATMTSLNNKDIVSCVWSSKVQFMVYLSKPITRSTVDISFNAGILKEDSQTIARLNDHELKVTVRKLTTEWWSYAPKLVITGPSEIPRCGVFALTGHFSSPSGALGYKFSWAIEKEDKSPVDEELSLFVAAIDKQNLILDAIAFEVGTNYVLTMRASGPGDQTLSATHRLIKFNYDAPIVSVFSNIMLPQSPLTVDQEAVFWAETYVPVCVYPFQRVGLFWKVLDPVVKFNFSLAYSPVYIVSPYAIPEDKPVTFYLSAFLGHRTSQTSGAGFTIVGQQAPLKAVIAGGSPMVSLGSQSGWFELSGTESGPGHRKEKLVYQWTCIDSDTHQPCYDHSSDHSSPIVYSGRSRDPLLVNRTMQKSPSLAIHSSQLEADKELIFALQVFDANDTQRSSETELLLVKVTKGSAPQVFMGPIYVNGKHRATVRSPHNLAIVVPAHTGLVVKGRVRHPSGIKNIRWEAPNFVNPLHWVNQMESPFEISSELHIHPDYTFPYGFHVVKLVACGLDDTCSESLTQFTASQGVTGCQLSVDSYEEYEFVTITVERCNIPPNYAPLVYQLFAVDPSFSFPVPLTVPQFSSVFIFPGPPALALNSHTNTFGTQVCDVFEFCQIFYSSVVEVRPSANVTQDGIDLLDLAKKYNTAGDPVSALSILSVILKKTDQNPQIRSTAIQRVVEYSVEGLTVPGALISKGQVAMVYHALGETLRYTDSSLLRRRALDAIHKTTQKALAFNSLPDLTTVDSTLNAIFSSYRFEEKKEQNSANAKNNATSLNKDEDQGEDFEVFASVRNTVKMLLEAAASQVPLGSRTEFGRLGPRNEDISQAYTVLVHDNVLQDISVETQYNETSGVEGKVRFDAEVKDRFAAPWTCDVNGSKQCHSVVYSVTLYPRNGPFPVKKHGHRMTPILDVSIYSPASGHEQHVQGFLNAITMSLSITGDESEGGPKYRTKCYFWSEEKQAWKTDGVHSSGTANGQATCWAGHLTAFTVIRGPDNYDKATFVGIVVAIFMAILIVGLMITYCVHRRQESKVAQVAAQQLVGRR